MQKNLANLIFLLFIIFLFFFGLLRIETDPLPVFVAQQLAIEEPIYFTKLIENALIFNSEGQRKEILSEAFSLIDDNRILTGFPAIFIGETLKYFGVNFIGLRLPALIFSLLSICILYITIQNKKRSWTALITITLAASELGFLNQYIYAQPSTFQMFAFVTIIYFRFYYGAVYNKGLAFTFGFLALLPVTFFYPRSAFIVLACFVCVNIDNLNKMKSMKPQDIKAISILNLSFIFGIIIALIFTELFYLKFFNESWIENYKWARSTYSSRILSLDLINNEGLAKVSFDVLGRMRAFIDSSSMVVSPLFFTFSISGFFLLLLKKKRSSCDDFILVILLALFLQSAFINDFPRRNLFIIFPVIVYLCHVLFLNIANFLELHIETNPQLNKKKKIFCLGENKYFIFSSIIIIPFLVSLRILLFHGTMELATSVLLAWVEIIILISGWMIFVAQQYFRHRNLSIYSIYLVFTFICITVTHFFLMKFRVLDYFKNLVKNDEFLRSNFLNIFDFFHFFIFFFIIVIFFLLLMVWRIKTLRVWFSRSFLVASFFLLKSFRKHEIFVTNYFKLISLFTVKAFKNKSTILFIVAILYSLNVFKAIDGLLIGYNTNSKCLMVSLDEKIGSNSLIEGSYFSLYSKNSIPFWATHVDWKNVDINKIDNFIFKNSMSLHYPLYYSRPKFPESVKSLPYLGYLWKPNERINCSVNLIQDRLSKIDSYYFLMEKVDTGACYNLFNREVIDADAKLAKDRQKIGVRLFKNYPKVCY